MGWTPPFFPEALREREGGSGKADPGQRAEHGQEDVGLRQNHGGGADPQVLRGHEGGLGRDPLEGTGFDAAFPASPVRRHEGMVESRL